MSQDSMCHAREMSALALMVTLPQELQNRIFQLSEIDELLVLCRLNTFWYRKTIPWIWEDIDFVTDVDEYFAVDRSRSFFALCDKLIDEQPGRWAIMAASVRKLNLGRLHGINIVYEEWTGDEYPFFIEGEKNDASGRNVFSIVAEFTNLNKLSVYVKNHWEWVGCSNAKKALSKGLQNLKSLKIGGQIPEGIIDGLLHKPEIIEDLAIINLHDTPGQDDGPNGRTFLSMEDESRFTSLKTLHLCKLADLDGRSLAEWDDNDDGQEFVSGMRWKFPREADVIVLEEWASLLDHSSNTLEEVTLENRYLCHDGPKIVNPGVTDPDEWGQWSTQESQKHLFPVLAKDWPKLRKMTLVGMGMAEEVAEAVKHLEPRVEIEQRLASTQDIGGDVTPMQIDTPVEFYDYYESHQQENDQQETDEQEGDEQEDGEQEDGEQEDGEQEDGEQEDNEQDSS